MCDTHEGVADAEENVSVCQRPQTRARSIVETRIENHHGSGRIDVGDFDVRLNRQVPWPD